MIKTIITTNWDDFFERECDFDAFVNGSDMALWEASERRLMKIHGSIRNLGSIVATEDDYRKAFQRLNDGPMGAQLKTLLTQKTFVYTGYSLSDDTYIRIAKSIGEMTAPHTRHSYFVAPNIDRNKISNFPIPLIPIETDGAFFFETLRLHLEHKVKLIPEHAFTACEDLLELAIDIHQETASALTRTHHPLLIFLLSYQDGLIHGLKRIIKRQMSGEYHCRDHLIHLVQSYEMYSKKFRKKHDYWNSSYSDGYRDAMMYLLIIAENPEAKGPPIFGEHGNVSFNSLSSVTRFPKKRIKKCYRVQADRFLTKLIGDSQSYVPQHTPYL